MYLGHNYLVGSLPDFGTAVSTDMDFNCFEGCSVLHQSVCPCAIVAALASSELNALMALYNGTDGAAWTMNNGWVDYPLSDPCMNLWWGVSCGGASAVGLPNHVTYVGNFKLACS